jgi:hypothetical protein
MSASGQPSRAMALGTDPHAGACRRSPLPIRSRARAGYRQTTGGEWPVLFETSRVLTQPRLFWLDALGEEGWLKAPRLEEYAPRGPRRPVGVQEVLFPYAEAL